MVVPEWIRSIGNGQVELLAGQEPGEPTYIAELFLRPDYTKGTVTKTAALWFLAILTSRDGGFHTLVEEAHQLNNPAAIAEIYCYRRLEDERTKLTCELNRISDALASVRNQLDGCHFRMEGAQLPLLL
jgi:transposase-like protein